MKKTPHIFKQFDIDSLTVTTEAWKNDAFDGFAFPIEVEQLMAWVSGHVDEIEGDSVAYGVFPPNSKIADAICEVAVTRKSVRSKWVKMLRIRLRPTIDDALNSSLPNDSEVGIKNALEIFVQATVGLLKFGEHQKANTIKIYGRTKQQTDFLGFLAIELQKINEGRMKASMEGKFLVVKSI